MPKGETGPFPIQDLEPDPPKKPVEDYVSQVEACIEKYGIPVLYEEDFQNIEKVGNEFAVITRTNRYIASNVILAFGSNIPIDLGVYGEAKTIARSLDNPSEHLNAPTLVLGGGNAAADIVFYALQGQTRGRRFDPYLLGAQKGAFCGQQGCRT